MTTPLILHAAPAAGFDEPFELLAACHQRVERMLGLLQRLQPHLQAHGADRAGAEAARDLLRYFDLAAPHHHEDEELHVLPVLAYLNATPEGQALIGASPRVAAWIARMSERRSVQAVMPLA